MNNVKFITEYEDGTTSEVTEHATLITFHTDLEADEDRMHMEMCGFTSYDLIRLTYGLLVTIEKEGLSDVLKKYADGEMD